MASTSAPRYTAPSGFADRKTAVMPKTGGAASGTPGGTRMSYSMTTPTGAQVRGNLTTVGNQSNGSYTSHNASTGETTHSNYSVRGAQLQSSSWVTRNSTTGDTNRGTTWNRNGQLGTQNATTNARTGQASSNYVQGNRMAGASVSKDPKTGVITRNNWTTVNGKTTGVLTTHTPDGKTTKTPY
jgi:hypothetical protein